ncbi:MAG: hypothetical protein KBE65_08225 [Phycisphaerae bacterium]|nr:hypothetical protein [Phycisphaerae bacterium]
MKNHESMKDRLVSLALGELSEREGCEVRTHVSGCDLCRAELRQIEQLLDYAARRKGLSADESLHESARDGLFAAAGKEKESDTTTRPSIRRVLTGRRTMTSSIVKLALAAAAVIAVAFFGLSTLPSASDGGYSLLAKACAAEERLFAGTQIVHIQNEIIVCASSAGTEGATEADHVWLPMCSLKADGGLQVNQLKLSVAPESYVVTDHSWYDPTTGRFSRILKAGGAVVSANSWDGGFVYHAGAGADGVVRVTKEPAAEQFKPPESPAAYLGLAAGLKTSLARDDRAVQSVEEGVLADGRSVHIYKVGTPDPSGQLPGYWLFKVRDDDSTIAEKEFVLEGRSRLLVRRVLTESVETPAVSWSLAELEGTAAGAAPQVAITPDMVVPNVSVRHMVERATFQTYVPSAKPAWVGDLGITDAIDPASPGTRMFIMAARAEDGRHLVLVQSPTYNKMFGQFVKQGQVVYTSPNGFKVHGGGPQKWYSGILLQSAQYVIKDPPSEDRIGYILESPAGTFPALAINGPVTDAELHRLVDSLTPATEYLKSHVSNNQQAQP